MTPAIPNAAVDSFWEVPQFEERRLRGRKSRFAVLIPVLNEGSRIQTQLARMRTLLDAFDTVLVDGGSTDGTLAHVCQASTGLTAVLQMKTVGLSSQMRVGLAWILREGYEGVVLIDGNNKDNPDAIPRFVDRLIQGQDHIQGSRFIKGGKAVRNPLKRILAIRFIHAPLLSMAARFWYTDTTNGFRAYSRRFLLDARVRPFRSVFQKYELHYYLSIRSAELGFKVSELPVERAYPEDGSVPTKIGSLAGEWKVFKTLLMACLHRFDPKHEGDSR